jgi:hypothetical protein
MKLDKLESFIKDNREKLDTQTAPEDVWQGIEKGLPQPVRNAKMIYWQAAAILFFVLSLGLLVNNFRGNESNNSQALGDMEFNKTEQYYFNIIEDKEVLLTNYIKDYPTLANDFKKDLKELSKNYQKLKTEFEKNKSEEVLNALIQNLQLQQNLLNNQLNIIHQITKENENVSI